MRSLFSKVNNHKTIREIVREYAISFRCDLLVEMKLISMVSSKRKSYPFSRRFCRLRGSLGGMWSSLQVLEIIGIKSAACRCHWRSSVNNVSVIHSAIINYLNFHGISYQEIDKARIRICIWCVFHLFIVLLTKHKHSQLWHIKERKTTTIRERRSIGWEDLIPFVDLCLEHEKS